MAIIGTLPFTLTNGTLANADEVMADFNAIVSQVNTNALPSGGALTAGLEWTLLNDAPTYVSATSFTMPGDQTTTFAIGRRVKSVNTGGTTYSTVIHSVAVLNTTVTVVNTSGTLDAGLSAVSIGTLNSVNQSLPLVSYTSLIAGCPSIASNTATQLVALGANIKQDYLSEWVSPNFTARVTGVYQVTYLGGHLNTGGVNVTAGSGIVLAAYPSTGGSTTMALFNWPYGAGVQTNDCPISGAAEVSLAAGDSVQVKITFAVFTGSGMALNGGQLIIQRLLY